MDLLKDSRWFSIPLWDWCSRGRRGQAFAKFFFSFLERDQGALFLLLLLIKLVVNASSANTSFLVSVKEVLLDRPLYEAIIITKHAKTNTWLFQVVQGRTPYFGQDENDSDVTHIMDPIPDCKNVWRRTSKIIKGLFIPKLPIMGAHNEKSFHFQLSFS